MKLLNKVTTNLMQNAIKEAKIKVSNVFKTASG